MAYPIQLRLEARRLRSEERLSVDEISARLGVSKTTVWRWIGDVPLGRERRSAEAQRLGTQAMQRKYRQQRERAYREGRESFARLSAEPTFRDFVCVYLAQGYKRSPNVVAVASADDGVTRLAAHWLRALSRNRVTHSPSAREGGAVTVRACDTQLRARLQGWMDSLRAQWLDSLHPGA